MTVPSLSVDPVASNEAVRKSAVCVNAAFGAWFGTRPVVPSEKCVATVVGASTVG